MKKFKSKATTHRLVDGLEITGLLGIVLVRIAGQGWQNGCRVSVNITTQASKK